MAPTTTARPRSSSFTSSPRFPSTTVVSKPFMVQTSTEPGQRWTPSHSGTSGTRAVVPVSSRRSPSLGPLGSTSTATERITTLRPTSTRVPRTTVNRRTTMPPRTTSRPITTLSSRTTSRPLTTLPLRTTLRPTSTPAPRTTLSATSQTSTFMPSAPTAAHFSPGGTHVNFSTHVPPVTQSQQSSLRNQRGSSNTAAIVVGVLIPLILICILAVTFYIWYRKKYPVRMGIGRNFSTFSNPAYNKRTSTLTLVREDANKCFEELAQRNPTLSEDDDEDNLYQNEGIANKGFEEEAQEYENLKLRPNEPDKTTESIDEVTKDSEESKEPVTPNVKERPRKKAVLIMSEEYENLENGFEIVTESDLGLRRPSEISVGNDSTDTHTVSLTFSDTFDGRHDRKLRSQSEYLDMLKSNKGGVMANGTNLGKPRSQSDSAGQLQTNKLTLQARTISASALSSFTIPEKQIDSDEEFVKIEDTVNKVASGELPEEVLSEIHHDGSPKQTSPKRLSLTMATERALSTESIVLDTVPPTPTVLVQESIIFEPETPNPIHLDLSSPQVLSPRRGRRAFTLNDIVFKIDKAVVTDSQYTEEKSKSSPEIFKTLTEKTGTLKESLEVSDLSAISASDTNLTRDPVSNQIVQVTRSEYYKSIDSIASDIDLAGTDFAKDTAELQAKAVEAPNKNIDLVTEKRAEDVLEIQTSEEAHPVCSERDSGSSTLSENDSTSDSEIINDVEVSKSIYLSKEPNNETEKTCKNDDLAGDSFDTTGEESNATNMSSSETATSDLPQTDKSNTLAIETDRPLELFDESHIDFEKDNFLCSSTPTGDSKSIHLWDIPPKSLSTEENEKQKLRISSQTFNFDINDDEVSSTDTSSEDIVISKCTTGTGDCTQEPEVRAQTETSCEELDHINEESESHKLNPKDTETDLTRSTASWEMSYEVHDAGIDITGNKTKNSSLETDSSSLGSWEMQDEVNVTIPKDSIDAKAQKNSSPEPSLSTSWDVIEDSDSNGTEVNDTSQEARQSYYWEIADEAYKANTNGNSGSGTQENSSLEAGSSASWDIAECNDDEFDC